MTIRMIAITIALGLVPAGAGAVSVSPPPGLEAMLSYPFLGNLVSAERADRIAWIVTKRGVRNLWIAAGPNFVPRALTHATQDDGQELTSLAFSPDGGRIAWVRGGDHDANWAGDGGLEPNPGDGAEQPQLEIWSAATAGGPAVKVAQGDAPALSADGRIAYLKDGQVWATDFAGKVKPERLFFDRGKARELAWSPDGTKLAFVSGRGDHAFIGIFTTKDRPIRWIAPSTGSDGGPTWSPDGTRIAFTRRPGDGGAPERRLKDIARPWSIWTGSVASGEAAAIWRSPVTLNGSYPSEPGLTWAAGDRLTFRAEQDGWPHLYSVPAAGGAALLLTPGPYMVEHVTLSRDRRSLLYSANTGGAAEDDDRRHVFRVPVDRPVPVALTYGEGVEWTPVAAADNRVAFISATVRRPASLHVVGMDGAGDHPIDAAVAYPTASLVVPQRVTFRAADGLTIHGQLFSSGTGGRKPAVIFVHGGPSRQMLLGWHYRDYYANAYAVNQYLAVHGFVVLSVNYRLGIGYGRAFQHPAKGGPTGAAEYQDVVAGAHFLKTLAQVDPARIGIWGGSYGGYLTAMALARDSAIFKAGVDLHGVHDWSRLLYEEEAPAKRYEQGDWDAAIKVAFQSSPVADVATWRSPVLLIQGDDDRNVRFNQTVDLARRLDAGGIDHDEIVIPNEIHGFLRFASWLRADSATVNYLAAQLKP